MCDNLAGASARPCGGSLRSPLAGSHPPVPITRKTKSGPTGLPQDRLDRDGRIWLGLLCHPAVVGRHTAAGWSCGRPSGDPRSSREDRLWPDSEHLTGASARTGSRSLRSLRRPASSLPDVKTPGSQRPPSVFTIGTAGLAELRLASQSSGSSRRGRMDVAPLRRLA